MWLLIMLFIALEIGVGAAYPIAALLFFLVAFVLVIIYAFLMAAVKNKRR